MTHPNSADDSTSSPELLRLDHFLKFKFNVDTGGQAKLLIQNGEVKVNGRVETRRRKKLSVGDVIEVGGKSLVVAESSQPERKKGGD